MPESSFMETRILRPALASPLHQKCSTHTSLWSLNFYYNHPENVLTGQKASTKSLHITIAIINTISSSWASSSLPVCRFFLFGLPPKQRRVLGYMQRGRTISRLVSRVRTLRLRKGQSLQPYKNVVTYSNTGSVQTCSVEGS